MSPTTLRWAAVIIFCAVFGIGSAEGLSVREYRKFERDKQAVYVGAAVSMAANMYAAQGQTARASCIMDWYFRDKDGKEPTGPYDLALEVGVAERRDPDGYQIEGVILGIIEQRCGTR